MFFLALVYLIVLVVLAVFTDWQGRWKAGIAEIVLFIIIGIALFYPVLNK